MVIITILIMRIAELMRNFEGLPIVVLTLRIECLSVLNHTMKICAADPIKYFAAFIESRFRSRQSAAKASLQARFIPLDCTLADIY